MRLAAIILGLTAMALVHVHMEQRRLSARREIQQLQMRQVTLRRRMWDQQVELGKITAPQEVRRRADQMAVMAD